MILLPIRIFAGELRIKVVPLRPTVVSNSTIPLIKLALELIFFHPFPEPFSSNVLSNPIPLSSITSVISSSSFVICRSILVASEYLMMLLTHSYDIRYNDISCTSSKR